MDKSRLYYQIPYVKSFMCTVEHCEESGKGTWLVTLNQTGFYPEGGGQPYDTGTLNGISVVSVHEKGEQVIHELAQPIEEGTLAEGIIDWQRRYDNMQLHTGEHILSGLVHKHFGYDNVGFHMGAEEVTVDFNGIIEPEDLDWLEDEANQLVYANVPVKVLYPSEDELRTMEYRSKKELSGLVRIVEVPGADVCACCGTHVENTGEVGFPRCPEGALGHEAAASAPSAQTAVHGFAERAHVHPAAAKSIVIFAVPVISGTHSSHPGLVLFIEKGRILADLNRS